MKYVTYLIIYKGDLFPPYYIGSTSLKKINSGYFGSVCSKKYKRLWLQEQKENPELFETLIVQEFDTRKDALKYELQLQKEHDVVKNSLFVNMAYARPNGYFGKDMAGENNTFFKKTHSIKNKKIIGDVERGVYNHMFKGYYHTPFGVLTASTDINKHTDKLSRDSIILYCKKYLDKAISKKSIAKSKYLTEDMLGKTYRKIGFWFEPV